MLKEILDLLKFVVMVTIIVFAAFFLSLAASLGWHTGLQSFELHRDVKCMERTMELLQEHKAATQ
jgi:hypothetical protein